MSARATSVAFESPYGWGRQTIQPPICCDGKLYTYSGEHSPTYPLARDKYLRCVNATDGTLIWKLLYCGGSYSTTALAISDGYLIGLNNYDCSIYCIGIGPSATTVTASPKVSTHGTSVVIEGTVTDQSPGSKDTPAISDDDMGDWMEYLYEEQAMPANAKGVQVTLDALDPNGNFVPIGTVTSDISGTFGYAFTPEVPGMYQIIATFAGSASYGSSFAETYINVEEAPAATPAPTPTPASIADMYLVPATIGIIVAIVAVGLLLFLLLRKR